MEVRVWGCRGSLPTPGPDTIRYGGNTSCVEIRLEDGTLIIFDAGSGIRPLGNALLKHDDIREVYLFLTHAHWDHLLGFPFFRPAYRPDYQIHVRGGPLAKTSVERFLRRQMEPPFFPVSFEVMQAAFDFTAGAPIVRQVGSASVIPIQISHPNGGYGFKVVEDDHSFVFLPDNELGYAHPGAPDQASFAAFCEGADLLFHDAQYTDEEYTGLHGWGHSPLSAVVDLSMAAGVSRLGLFHHDPAHDDAAVDAIAATTRALIAAAHSPVDCFAVQEGMRLRL